MGRQTKQYILLKTFGRAYYLSLKAFYRFAIIFLILSFGFVQPPFVSANTDLTELSLEDLMNVDILTINVLGTQ